MVATSLLRFLVDNCRQGVDGGLIIPNDLAHGAENFIGARFRQVRVARLVAERFEVQRLFLGLKLREFSEAQFRCSAADGSAC